MKTAVIGGGAAGLCAAVTAREKGDSVVLFERADRVGKKILASGNGRCNIMNTGPLRYPGGGAFAAKVFEAVTREDLSAFFARHGLALREEAEGRVYPATGKASTVLNVLLGAALKYGVDIRAQSPVRRAEARAEGGFLVLGEVYDKLIVTGGGKAQVKPDGDEGAYGLLGALGHPVTPLQPSLTPLLTERDPIKGLSGQRVAADVALVEGGICLARETGELLFTDYGVSGVCVMQLARYAQPGAALHIDLRRAMGFLGEDLTAYFDKRRRELPFCDAGNFLTGLFTEPLIRQLTARARLTGLSDETLNRLSDIIRRYDIKVTGRRGFEHAQVTAGGADLHFFHPRTLESALHRHLHAAGEILDVDGACGGFNLMFACVSGIAAARAE